MELSPILYHWFVRPKWFANRYANNTLRSFLFNYEFKNKAVLDFGCGVGSNSMIFDSNGYLGIDRDLKRVKYANKLYPNHKFNTVLENTLPLEDKSFDYIFIMAVLHHIPSIDISNYLKEFKRILKEDSEIIVIEPCNFNGYNLSNWYMNFFDKGKYIRNELEYLKLFQDEGYSTTTKNKFKKYIYNEIFFTAKPN